MVIVGGLSKIKRSKDNNTCNLHTLVAYSLVGGPPTRESHHTHIKLHKFNQLYNYAWEEE